MFYQRYHDLHRYTRSLDIKAAIMSKLVLYILWRTVWGVGVMGYYLPLNSQIGGIRFPSANEVIPNFIHKSLHFILSGIVTS